MRFLWHLCRNRTADAHRFKKDFSFFNGLNLVRIKIEQKAGQGVQNYDNVLVNLDV